MTHGYKPQSKLWKLYRELAARIIPSAARDCSTYQSCSATHTELESHNKVKPSPVFLIAGGPQAKNNETIIAAMLKLSGKPSPSVAYIGTASGDDRTFFNMFKQMFIAAGAGSVTLVPIVRKFNKENTEKILNDCDLIFISGGEVAGGMDYLTELNLIPLLTDLFNFGKPFAGVSAGAIMLCKNWMRWKDENDDNTVHLLDCLGFVPLLCDVHAEEDDWEEMKRLLGFFPDDTVGYGIPTGGALQVTASGEVTIIGSAPVQFIKKGTDIIIV
jgi:peptidase E